MLYLLYIWYVDAKNSHLREQRLSVYVSTSTTLWFCIKIGGCRSVFVLREINNDSVLEGLKITSHLAAHLEILSRSLLRHAAAVMASSTMMK